MKLMLGNLPVTLVPITNMGIGSRAREVYRKSVEITQTWHCNSKAMEPKTPKRKMDIETNLLFLAFDTSGNANRVRGDRLAIRFLAQTGFKTGTALNDALQKMFGQKKDVKIPYDALMMHARDRECRTLSSTAEYAYLQVTFAGQRANEEVILSVPTFVQHTMAIIGKCNGDDHVDVGFLVALSNGDIKGERHSLKPMPKAGSLARRLYYKRLVASTKDKLFRILFESDLDALGD